MTGLSFEVKAVAGEMRIRRNLSPRVRKLYDQVREITRKAIMENRGEELLTKLGVRP